MLQALLEQDQPADAAVAVLEGVDALKLHMKFKEILEGDGFLAVVVGKQPFHLGGHILRKGRLHAADFVGRLFVIAHGGPVLFGVACTGFKEQVQMLDPLLAQPQLRAVDDLVNTAEMIGRFDDIVHADALVGDADGVGFKDIAGLVVGETAALDMVGIVGQFDLDFMINPAADLSAFFLLENGK